MPVPSNVRKITRILETNILTSQFRKQGNLPFFNNAHIRFTTRAFYIIAQKKFKSWLANTWHIYWKGGDDVTCWAGCGFNEQNKSSALTLFVRKSLDNFRISKSHQLSKEQAYFDEQILVRYPGKVGEKYQMTLLDTFASCNSHCAKQKSGHARLVEKRRKCDTHMRLYQLVECVWGILVALSLELFSILLLSVRSKYQELTLPRAAISTDSGTTLILFNPHW